jgi:hypothetical protein
MARGLSEGLVEEQKDRVECQVATCEAVGSTWVPDSDCNMFSAWEVLLSFPVSRLIKIAWYSP